MQAEALSSLPDAFLEWKNGNTWVLVWPVLDGYQFNLFAKKTDTTPAGKIDLNKAIIHDDPVTPTYKKFCWELVVDEDDPSKGFLLCGKVQRVKEKWLIALKLHKQGKFIEKSSIQQQPAAIGFKPAGTRTVGGGSSMSRKMSPTQSNPDISATKPSPIARTVSLGNVAADAKARSGRLSKEFKSGPLTSSLPSLPHMPQQVLAELVNSLKNTKDKRRSKRSFSPIKGDMSKAYLETVEGQVVEKWQKEPEELAVWVDFPRIVEQIQLFDERMNLISLPYTLKDGGSLEEEEGIKIRRSMRETLIMFSYKLLEKKELIDIEKHFMTSLSPEPSRHLKEFFEKYIPKDSKFLGLLKGLTQALTTPAYISLKDKFAALGMPIMDINGSWLIEAVFQDEDVFLIHSKRAKSVSEDPEEEFSFRWHLAIVFEKGMSAIKQARISMTDLDTNKQMKDKTRKKLQNIKDHELFV